MKRLIAGFPYLICWILFFGMFYWWIKEYFGIAAFLGVCLGCFGLILRARKAKPTAVPLFWWAMLWIWFLLVMFWLYPRGIVKELGVALFAILAAVLEIWERNRAKKLKIEGDQG